MADKQTQVIDFSERLRQRRMEELAADLEPSSALRRLCAAREALLDAWEVWCRTELPPGEVSLDEIRHLATMMRNISEGRKL